LRVTSLLRLINVDPFARGMRSPKSFVAGGISKGYGFKILYTNILIYQLIEIPTRIGDAWDEIDIDFFLVIKLQRNTVEQIRLNFAFHPSRFA